MAFDEVELPLKVGYGAQGGPKFLTEIVTTQGGYEKRNQVWAQARRVYDAATGVRSANDVAVLAAFFQARAGRARGFRLRDWADYSSAAEGRGSASASDQILGTGDGSTTSYQLIKNYGSGGVTYARAIRKPVAGTVCVAVGGVVQASGWSVDVTTGIVTFASAPEMGAVVSAGFLFDVPVRFDTDQLALVWEEARLARASVPMIEVRI